MPHTPNPRLRRILLVDDHPIVRTMLNHLISKDPWMEVCGEAEDAGQALRLIEETRPDAIIIDLDLRGSSGLKLIKKLQARKNSIPILVFSMHAEMLYAHRVLRHGAKGYISKEKSPRQIMKALRDVLTGRVHVSKQVGAQLFELAEPQPQKSAALAGMARLSGQERKIFRLLGEGLSWREIAVRLDVQLATVERHRVRINEKLGIRTAAQLTQLAALSVALPDYSNELRGKRGRAP